MRAIISILSAILAGSLFFGGYLAIWDPSPFGRFVHLREILLYGSCIATASFFLLAGPILFWLRHTHRRISPLAGFLTGLFLGCITMLLFMAVSGWPVHAVRLIAGSIAGAVGFSTYAKLSFKRVA